MTAALALALLVSLASPAPPPSAPPLASSPAADELLLDRIVPMVDHALEFLAQQQARDGSFSVERRTASRSAPIGVTALAALALMASGSTPDRGPYRDEVKRAIDWLGARCNDDGYFYFDGDSTSKMHGQGYALLALVQAYGEYGGDAEERARLRGWIVRAIDLIERTQGVTGGWYYEPKRQTGHENSITVCLLQSLRAARDAGFHVDPAVVRAAESYVQRTQAEDGRFRYGLNDPHRSWELTAGSLSALHAVGDYDSEALERGFDALQDHDPHLGRGASVNFPYYGAFYAAQAYWHYHDRRVFERWWERYVNWCEDTQRPDGSFHNGVFGSVYATAITALTLQMPHGSLPFFQR